MWHCSPCLSLMTRDPWVWEHRFPRAGHTPGCQQAISSYHVTKLSRDLSHQTWSGIRDRASLQMVGVVSPIYLFHVWLCLLFSGRYLVIIAVFSIGNYRWLICFVRGRGRVTGRGVVREYWLQVFYLWLAKPLGPNLGTQNTGQLAPGNTGIN